ncbi:hypothetical protein CVT26_003278 [Gymnopilus dilepis]|uniref:Condensin complex subunit 1 C-terminal domain-containing protein n=1 Tax=Gymnopilus dilepis TaxID=231916 RepID=A0A409Y561_9AGAR|nr:hypothetical protein CVT26_003278 [Gymnopilus dilepis]
MSDIDLHSCYDQAFHQSAMSLVIPAMAERLTDNDVDVRYAALHALTEMSSKAFYQKGLKEIILKIVTILNSTESPPRQAVIALVKLSGQDAYQETLVNTGVISRLIVDGFSGLGNPDERQAFQTLIGQASYKAEVRASIPKVVKQLENWYWRTRQQAVNMLTLLSGQLASLQDSKSEAEEAIAISEEIDLKAGTILGKVAALLKDEDEDVREAVIKALEVFANQERLKTIIESENIVSKITGQLKDEDGDSRAAAIQTLAALRSSESFQDKVKTSIPQIISLLGDGYWKTRWQAIQVLGDISGQGEPACAHHSGIDFATGVQVKFQENLKAEKAVAAIVRMLQDSDEDVRAAAATALPLFADQDVFRDTIRVEKALHNLIALLEDSYADVCTAAVNALKRILKTDNVTNFLPSLLPDIYTIKSSVRLEFYKILNDLTSIEETKAKIEDAASNLASQMQNRDLRFSCQTIGTLTEIMTHVLQIEALNNKDQLSSATQRTAAAAIETTVQSKLIHSKDAADWSGVATALSQLANLRLFRSSMKPAIPWLVDTVSHNAPSVWISVVSVISNLAGEDELRSDLVPAVVKIIQRLLIGDDEEQHRVVLIEALSNFACHKQFSSKLKSFTQDLIKELGSDSPGMRALGRLDQKEIRFSQAAYKFLGELCKNDIVGRDLIPHLLHILPEIHPSLASHLVELVKALSEHAGLTVNDCIALASSLSVIFPTGAPIEVQVSTLQIAAILHEGTEQELSASECNRFCRAIFGSFDKNTKDNLLQPKDSKPENLLAL